MPNASTLLTALAAVLVLGTSAQWLAWRLRFPSILMMLGFGIIAGPVLGFVQPDQMLGDLLFPIVSLSVAVILFEGALGLQLRELKEIGRVLGRMLTIGVIVSWVLTTIFALYVLDFGLFKSILLGAILVVTGPTVIGPMLRHIRPSGKVGPIARWEGIIIDPIGAVLAVLVFESYEAFRESGVDSATMHAMTDLGMTVLAGGGLGTVAAIIVGFLLKRHLIPDHLENPVTLMFVLGCFVGCDHLQEESGLVGVTVMGTVMANIKGLNLRPILEFKENLTVLLISSLFILLAARLDLSAFQELGWRGPAFVVLMILIVRPASVFLSTIGTALTRNEKLFLSWMAPRGIVAASVAAVFALRLGIAPTESEPMNSEENRPGAIAGVEPDSDTNTPLAEAKPLTPVESAILNGNSPGKGLVPATFMVILGTVSIYGLTAGPLATRLGLASANPQGVLFVGADAVARKLATALLQAGFKVLLVDVNRWNIQAARMEGLPTANVNILSDQALNELDLGGIGRAVGVTPNNEVNSLAALHLASVFGRAGVYQFANEKRDEGKGEDAEHLRARPLFRDDVTHTMLRERFQKGAILKKTKLSAEFTFADFKARYGESAIPLFAIEESALTILTGESGLATAGEKKLEEGEQTLIALVDEVSKPLDA